MVVMEKNTRPQQTEKPQSYDAARVREARLRDAPAIAELYEQSWPEREVDEETIRGWLEHGGALMLEDDEGRAVSVLCWTEKPYGWQLDPLAIRADYREHGLERWLMTKAEALAIQDSVASLHLHFGKKYVGESYDDWLTFYRRLGYQVSEENEVDAEVHLSKQIGGTWQYQQR